MDQIENEGPPRVILSPASGQWITAREAKSMVEKICSIDGTEAIQAICRRAVYLVPVSVLSWRRGEEPHDYVNKSEYFLDKPELNCHFKRDLDFESWNEMLLFFEAIGSDSGTDEWAVVEYGSWATGDFRVQLHKDFSDVTLIFNGLQFDPLALQAAFTSTSNASTIGPSIAPRNVGGRPASAAWPNWIAELAHYIHEQGFPDGAGSQGLESIISTVADRLETRGLSYPSRATVQPAVRAVLDRLRAPDT